RTEGHLREPRQRPARRQLDEEGPRRAAGLPQQADRPGRVGAGPGRREGPSRYLRVLLQRASGDARESRSSLAQALIAASPFRAHIGVGDGLAYYVRRPRLAGYFLFSRSRLTYLILNV